MASAKIFETSVTNNGLSQDSNQPDDLFQSRDNFVSLFSALQLVEYPHNNGLEVIFAGGRKKMTPKNLTDPEYPDKTGERLDGRNLIKEWVDKYPNSQYVWNKTAFHNIDPNKVNRVMGKSVGGMTHLRVSGLID